MSLPAGTRDARPVGGGDINEAFRVVMPDGSDAFVKTRADAAPGEYAAEAAGLRWLAEAGALRTPCVLDVDDGYLALQWIEPGRLDAAGERELGSGLAATHMAHAPRFGRFDDTDAAWLGPLELSNEPTLEWAQFYAERRLAPMARLARERGALSAVGAAAVERICERMPELAGPPEPAARLHGDLWSGNVLADTQGRPWLIDPSAYGGHREVDLAMLALFGSPSRELFDAYQDVAPLADGWPERVGLYQLLPLLVHTLLFGGSYRDSAERMARRYA
ncbi:MAG TPA: fructosamine kinase family protein [Solirubrobacteraceae bacterium]|nr:fructosamine kinase family protein [Solirubrobacteraceae bacterium]